jgi:hypothetical protein
MTASTVAQYLAALPADRRAALSGVRKVINENLPDGYEEGRGVDWTTIDPVLNSVPRV